MQWQHASEAAEGARTAKRLFFNKCVELCDLLNHRYPSLSLIYHGMLWSPNVRDVNAPGVRIYLRAASCLSCLTLTIYAAGGTLDLRHSRSFFTLGASWSATSTISTLQPSWQCQSCRAVAMTGRHITSVICKVASGRRTWTWSPGCQRWFEQGCGGCNKAEAGS